MLRQRRITDRRWLRWHRRAGVLGVGLLSAAPLHAQPRPQAKLSVPESVAVEAYSASYVSLSQRSFSPGPAGSIPTAYTALPVYEYFLLRVVDADVPWAKNSVDAELSMWAMGSVVRADSERVLDGDVSVASVTHRVGRASFKLGRQYVTEGAARFSHLDGIYAGVRTEEGIALSGYAGFTVLPRWDARPNYRLLGSAADLMVNRPEDLPRSTRGDNWMMGARAGYSHSKVGEIGVSMHEQREDGALGRRDLAADLHLPGSSFIDGSARVLLDMDSRGLADAFAGVALHPTRPLDIAIDYRRMTPTLLMSRQSVLSVFTVDRFDELGGEARYRLAPPLLVLAGAFVEWFGSEDMGVRARAGMRYSPGVDHRLLVQALYTRVTEPQNGYHGTRLSIEYRLAPAASLTGEQYVYVYDHAIRGIGNATVHAVTGSYRPLDALELMLTGSAAVTPYSALDARGMLRVSYRFGAKLGGEP